jgi:hypothetical protein
MSEKILSVQSVDLTIVKSEPQTLVIDARGVATTQGWKEPKLTPSYTKFPADGIQEFDFVAVPPDGMVKPVLYPVTAQSLPWNDPPAHLRAVRVYAESNEITVRIEDAKTCTV